MKLHRVKVLAGTHHRAGKKYVAGDILEVSANELSAFGDKFLVLTGVHEPEQLLPEKVQVCLGRGEKVRAMVKAGLHHRAGEDKLVGGDIFMADANEVAAFGDKFLFLAAPVKQMETDVDVVMAETTMGAGSYPAQTLHIGPKDVKISSRDDDVVMTDWHVNATEGAKTLARESGIDLFEATGSGKDGRIIKSDVVAFLESTADGNTQS